MGHPRALRGHHKGSQGRREAASTLINLSKETKGHAALPAITKRLSCRSPKPIVAAELTVNQGTSQHVGPNTNRATDLLKGGHHLRAQCEARKPRIGEG